MVEADSLTEVGSTSSGKEATKQDSSIVTILATSYCACRLGFRLSRSLQPFLYPFPSQAFSANDTCHVCRAKQVRLQLLNPNQDVFAFHQDGVRMTSCCAAAEPSSETWSLEIADNVGTPAVLLPTTTFQRSVMFCRKSSIVLCIVRVRSLVVWWKTSRLALMTPSQI